jgi:hypothetical protein
MKQSPPPFRTKLINHLKGKAARRPQRLDFTRIEGTIMEKETWIWARNIIEKFTKRDFILVA